MAYSKAERLSALEAARAVTIASHAAAGLAARSGATQAVRAFRVAEAMGRAATAMLTAHFEAPVSNARPVPASKPEAAAPGGLGGSVGGQGAQRKLKEKGKKDQPAAAKQVGRQPQGVSTTALLTHCPCVTVWSGRRRGIGCLGGFCALCRARCRSAGFATRIR